MLATHKANAAAPTNSLARTRSESVQKTHNLLQDLITNHIIFIEDWNDLSVEVREDLSWTSTTEELMKRLVEVKLLTQYQSDRILAGTRFGLILGNYRILERLGAGGMGIVFKGEHFIMRRLAAIKVLPFRGKQDDYLLRRFRSELKTVAALDHPNIVSAFDGGVEFSGDTSYPDIYYFAMEYVHGEDLESYVDRRKLLPIHESLNIIYQIGSAITEANKHNLVHRDIKPSNIMLPKNGVAKLLDFGLVRRLGHTMTDPGTVLGTYDYLAPEQAKDASNVDIRADIYSLGATLYFCLTGSPPFVQPANKTINLIARLNQDAPSVKTIREEVPDALNDIIKKMMAKRPENRFQEPSALLQALYPFILSGSIRDKADPIQVSSPSLSSPHAVSYEANRKMRILIVDDDAQSLQMMRTLLSELDIHLDSTDRALEAVALAQKEPIDLLIAAIEMHEMSGMQLIENLKGIQLQCNMKAILMSVGYSEEQMSHLLCGNVIDVIKKPFHKQYFSSRIKNAIINIAKYDEASRMIAMLVKINGDLEQSYQDSLKSSLKSKSCILQSFIKMIEKKIHEPTAHIDRIRLICKKIAAAASQSREFSELADDAYIDHLDSGSMFHDIGKILLPDTLIHKDGVYTEEERVVMQEHTIIGAKMLEDLMKKYLDEMPFLPVAVDIARHHHERFNGSGYPDRKTGDAIPLAARIVAIADVYDALRTDKPYRPAMSHNSALRIITTCSEGMYDPRLLRSFAKCEREIDDIFNEHQ